MEGDSLMRNLEASTKKAIIAAAERHLVTVLGTLLRSTLDWLDLTNVLQWLIALVLAQYIFGYNILWVLYFVRKWWLQTVIVVLIIAIFTANIYDFGINAALGSLFGSIGRAALPVFIPLIFTHGWKWPIPVLLYFAVIAITSVMKNYLYRVLTTGNAGIYICNWIVIAAKRVGSKAVEGCAYDGLAVISHLRGDSKKAVAYHTRHLCLAQEMGDKATEGHAYSELGYDFWIIDDSKAAIDYFKEQLRIVRDLGDKAEEREVYLNLHSTYYKLGSRYVVQGDFREARESYEAQLDIAINKLKERAFIGLAYRGLGNICFQQGDFRSAIFHFNLSLRVAKEVGDLDGEFCVYDFLCKAYYHLSNFAKATEFYTLQLSISKKAGVKAWEGRAYGNLGCIYAASGDLKRAIQCHDRHRCIAKDVGEKEEEAQAGHELGNSFELLELLPKSLEYHLSSMIIFNEVRDRDRSKDEWKISGWRKKYKASFTGLWRVLLKQGKIFRALNFAEKGREQALTDLTESRYGIPASLSVGEAEPYLDVWRKSFSSTVFLAVDGDEINIWALSEGRHVNFKKKKLDNALILNDMIQDAFDQIVVRKGVQCENRSMNAGREVSTTKRPNKKSSHPLAALYIVVIEPIADLVQGEELIIVPDGPLWLAPYAAFVGSDSKYLCESFRIRLIPSLTSLKMIKDCPEGYHCKSGALLVGDPWIEEVTNSRGKKLLKQLQFAKQEVEMIGEIIKVTPLTGKEATKAEVLKRLSSVGLVHIAAHGRMETGEIALSPNPERISSLPTKDDYVLTVTDVANAQLRASLVVLSCCHSAQGEIKAESVVGIARAFMGAGARSVLVSLWAIDDEATLEFMRSFYHHLVEGKSASESLNQAMKDLRESDKYSDVKYWAPFVLIGDDATLEFDGKPNEA